MTLYDSNGRAVAYSDDGETIYLYSGYPVAYLFGKMVYAFSGNQLGTMNNGWIRDNRGLCVFFTEDAIGGPIRPRKQIKPIKGIKRIKPIKGIRHIPRIKPVDQNRWSNSSGERFFMSV